MGVAARAGLLASLLGAGLLPAARLSLEHVVASVGVPVGARAAMVVVLFAAALGVASEVVALPFVCHTGFLLERRYGLSRVGFSAWVRGYAQTALARWVFWVAAVVFVYVAIDRWATWWWLAGGAAFAAVSVALTNLAPVVLLPRVFGVRPLGRRRLADRLEALARRAGAPVIGIHEWRVGAWTSRANAALVGSGSTRRILLSDTLIEDYSDAEIEVVLAHELAHHVHGDIWKMIACEVGVALFALCVSHHALTAVSPVLGLDGIGDVAGLPALVLCVAGVALAVLPLANVLSRRHERRADRYAIEVTGNREAFVSGLRRLGAQNLAEARPSRVAAWWFSSHPPLAERMAAARR